MQPQCEADVLGALWRVAGTSLCSKAEESEVWCPLVVIVAKNAPFKKSWVGMWASPFLSLLAPSRPPAYWIGLHSGQGSSPLSSWTHPLIVKTPSKTLLEVCFTSGSDFLCISLNSVKLTTKIRHHNAWLNIWRLKEPEYWTGASILTWVTL
jgi:hypothetical protein